jgi:hypothetical protein
MEFSNQKRAKTIKRSFNLGGIVIVAVGLVLLWLKQDTGVLVTAGVFALYVGVAQFANLSYISFSTENGRVLIKYYPVISFLKKNFDEVGFPHQSLLNFQIERSLGFSDLTIAIRTKRGVAEYPSISLAGLSKAEIEQIRAALLEIMKKNKAGI